MYRFFFCDLRGLCGLFIGALKETHLTPADIWDYNRDGFCWGVGRRSVSRVAV